MWRHLCVLCLARTSPLSPRSVVFGDGVGCPSTKRVPLSGFAGTRPPRAQLSLQRWGRERLEVRWNSIPPGREQFFPPGLRVRIRLSLEASTYSSVEGIFTTARHVFQLFSHCFPILECYLWSSSCFSSRPVLITASRAWKFQLWADIGSLLCSTLLVCRNRRTCFADQEARVEHFVRHCLSGGMI